MRTELKQTNTDSSRLESISRGVAIILWVVLTQALVWPIAAIYGGYQDEPMLSSSVMLVSSIISMVVSFGVTRWVFPLRYERVGEDEVTHT